MSESPDASPILGRRTALVTGAGRGIGRAIALAFAAAGAGVGLVSRTAAELHETLNAVEARGGRAIVLPADVTDARAIAAAIAETEARLGPLDILVNNAGVLGPIAPFADTDPEAWWRSLEVNLRGPMLACRSALPGMISRGSGRIINLATGMAPYAYFSGYAAGKTALVRFSESLAAEVRAQGVAVFSLGPGTVRTAMSEHSVTSEEGRRWIPWFKRIFDDGLDLPVEAPARLALQLASGRYDALSGLTVTPYDELDGMLARSGEIEAEKLYTLRLRTLAEPPVERLTSQETADEERP